MNMEHNERTGKTNETSYLSERDFAALGMNELAYIKPAVDAGYVIHAADGTALGQAETHELAAFAVRHHGLDLVSIH